MRLSDFKVLTFDCYGTLIDWESGMIEALRPLSSKAPRELARHEILAAHAFHESTQQRQTPAKLYRDLLAAVYKRLGEQWGVPTTHEQCLAYGNSVGDWAAFPDTPAALQYLKRFYKLVVLSNVDNQNFERTKRHLQIDLDAVVTAEDAGSYKPAIRNFEYMMERIGPGLGGAPIAKSDILHTAQSLFHDHKPANAFGLASCWIDRYHREAEGFGATVDPGVMPHLDFTFASLGAFADAHRAEQGG